MAARRVRQRALCGQLARAHNTRQGGLAGEEASDAVMACCWAEHGGTGSGPPPPPPTSLSGESLSSAARERECLRVLRATRPRPTHADASKEPKQRGRVPACEARCVLAELRSGAKKSAPRREERRSRTLQLQSWSASGLQVAWRAAPVRAGPQTMKMPCLPGGLAVCQRRRPAKTQGPRPPARAHTPRAPVPPHARKSGTRKKSTACRVVRSWCVHRGAAQAKRPRRQSVELIKAAGSARPPKHSTGACRLDLAAAAPGRDPRGRVHPAFPSRL